MLQLVSLVTLQARRGAEPAEHVLHAEQVGLDDEDEKVEPLMHGKHAASDEELVKTSAKPALQLHTVSAAAEHGDTTLWFAPHEEHAEQLALRPPGGEKKPAAQRAHDVSDTLLHATVKLPAPHVVGVQGPHVAAPASAAKVTPLTHGVQAAAPSAAAEPAAQAIGAVPLPAHADPAGQGLQLAEPAADVVPGGQSAGAAPAAQNQKAGHVTDALVAPMKHA